MKKIAQFPLLTVMCAGFILLAGCSSHGKICEDVTVAAEQVQQCQVLQRQISNTKDSPIVRAELERRYEQDCINLRYYRDDQQAAVCANKEKVNSLADQNN
ncbi:hypothetical protein [Thalassotalea atypica]|uniref:hypothetical protein n=1 Tax=Thalassotalea atypica TaxID=2054316 RepID=UPI0025743D1E|nr:hypothetical protein [Thalassotalea atypica]